MKFTPLKNARVFPSLLHTHRPTEYSQNQHQSEMAFRRIAISLYVFV